MSEDIVRKLLLIVRLDQLNDFLSEHPQYKHLITSQETLDELAVRNHLPRAQTLDDLIHYSTLDYYERLIITIKNDNYEDFERIIKSNELYLVKSRNHTIDDIVNLTITFDRLEMFKLTVMMYLRDFNDSSCKKSITYTIQKDQLEIIKYMLSIDHKDIAFMESSAILHNKLNILEYVCEIQYEGRYYLIIPSMCVVVYYGTTRIIGFYINLCLKHGVEINSAIDSTIRYIDTLMSNNVTDEIKNNLIKSKKYLEDIRDGIDI